MSVIEEKLEKPKETITEQTFIEPVYFKYKAKYFALKDVSGIKKVVIQIKDGNVVEAYAKITKVRRTARKLRGVTCEDSKYHFKSMDDIHRYFEFSLGKLIAKNMPYTLSDSGLVLVDYKNKLNAKINDFSLILYYVNAKFIGGYWMTLKGDPLFYKFEGPKYVKVRRCLQKLQLKSRVPETFDKNLMSAIQQAFIVKANNVPEFYGQD